MKIASMMNLPAEAVCGINDHLWISVDDKTMRCARCPETKTLKS